MWAFPLALKRRGSQPYRYLLVGNWDGLRRAFDLRHRLVHGIASCGREYAEKRVHWAIAALTDVRAVCASHGINLEVRLPVRKRRRA